MYAGCIKPLCDLLNVNEVKIIKVAMEGLENILKVGSLARLYRTVRHIHPFVDNRLLRLDVNVNRWMHVSCETHAV